VNEEIVGAYTDSANARHGFTLIRGNFSTVDVPNATSARVARVNDLGQIVGYTGVALVFGGSGFHGFLATPRPIGRL
jgi:hypothetical protein